MSTKGWWGFLLTWLALVPLQAEDRLNLPLPEDGLRYDDYPAFEQVWPVQHGEGTVCLWGDDKHAALSITIDDNNAPDIPFWQEMAEQYGWRFTWFLIVHPMMWDIYNDMPGSNTGYFGTALDYKPLLDDGHEIELHGSCKAMNHLSPEEYEEHALLSIKHLESQLGHQISTYAYPCGKIGQNGEGQAYRDVLEKHLIAARGTRGGATPVHLIDYMNTQSMGAVGTRKHPGEDRNFQRLDDNTRPIKYSSYRGWGVILYHGLKQTESREKVRQAFDWIKQNEDRYWIRPFSQVAHYAQQRESSQLEVTSVSPGEIVFQLTDEMRDDIFDQPLTLKFRADGWEAAAARQQGQPVPARMIEHEGSNYVLVDAVPDRGEIIIRQAAASQGR